MLHPLVAVDAVTSNLLFRFMGEQERRRAKEKETRHSVVGTDD
jgi:hypothetical protein